MIIGKDSAFRRLPQGLDQRQATFLEGIRYSVEMADLAYSRLRSVLWSLSTEDGLEHTQQDVSPFVVPFLDAWSIVDSVHRLRQLLEHMPGLKRAKCSSYQLFVRKTSPVLQFRNAIQHLRKELDAMSCQSWPVWGVLDWVAVIHSEQGLLCCCVMTAGKTTSGKYPVCNPLGMQMESPVDHVTLQYKEDRLSLSDTMRSVASVVRPLQESLARQFHGMSSTGSDLIVRVAMQVQLDESDRNC